jgi:outer membrane protein TolC
MATQSDLSAAQADLWRLDADILMIEQDIADAYNRLCGITGKSGGGEIPVLQKPEWPVTPTAEYWLNAARENYPSLKRANYLARSYSFSAAAARRMRWPMLGLSASYGFRSGSTTDTMSGEIMKWGDMISIQANISLPIFQGRQQNKMALSMKSMSASYEAEASQIWRDTEAEIRSLFIKYRKLAQSLSLYRERIIPADEDAYKSAFISFNSNSIPLSGLLETALDVYRDKLGANQIEYQLAQTVIDIERYTTDINNLK